MTETTACRYDQRAVTKWDRRFLAVADLVAGWSKDPSTKCGAVIARSKIVVSVGFNGFPQGVNDSPERYADRSTKLMMTVHAETNALLYAHQPVHGCAMYVTAPPCASCAAKIVQAGIYRLVYREPEAGFAERWEQDMAAAFQMFGEADVLPIPVSREGHVHD